MKQEIRTAREHNPSARQQITFLYNDKKIDLEIVFTKGGQKSIFADDIGGAWSIKIRRGLDKKELEFFDGKYSNTYIYLSYHVQDNDLVLQKNFSKEEDVAKEDRVGIFFTTDSNLEKYYCIEIDPQGRVLDYAASFYREFDSSWNCPGLRTAASMFEGGYIVEAAIPVSTLKQLGIFNKRESSLFAAGLFRAEFD